MIKLRKILEKIPKMSLENIKTNTIIIKDSINNIKSELNVVTAEYKKLLARQLREENAKLLQAVEDAKNRLIQLEVQNGVLQIALPGTKPEVAIVNVSKQQPTVNKNNQNDTNKSEPKVVKEKKVKAAKDVVADATVDIGRLDLRIGKVENVERHPDADSLYVLKVNCGEENQRTVCSGLVKHVPIDELKDRTVVLLCNLKPVKMRGITSEAMVMCASCENGVEVLIPPENSNPGDLVFCDGYNRNPDAVMNPKKKIFETVAPDLHTNDMGQACYKGTPWNVPSKGNVFSKSLKNVPVK